MFLLGNQKLLNFIIAISLAGIVIIAAKDYFFPKKEAQIQQTFISPIVRSISPVADPPSPCQNKYFSFKKGTKWKYAITSTTEAEGQKESFKSRLTTQITTIDPSSVTLESRFDRDQKSIKTQLFCKKSGIYGFPFPLVPEFDLSPALASIRFLPPSDEMRLNDVWQTPIDFGQPISAPAILSNKIIDRKDKRLTISADLVFTDETLKSFNGLTDELVRYELKEGVGISKMTIDIHLENAIRWQARMELIN